MNNIYKNRNMSRNVGSNFNKYKINNSKIDTSINYLGLFIKIIF